MKRILPAVTCFVILLLGYLAVRSIWQGLTFSERWYAYLGAAIICSFVGSIFLGMGWYFARVVSGNMPSARQ